jgi:adenine specific DNA methylase Mod
MPTLNANIENLKCYVRVSHFTKNPEDSKTFHKAYAFAIQSVAGKILTFHIMTFPLGVKIVASKTQLKTNVKDVWQKKNIHSTVKPVKLMQYLVRLITPPNGIVLDPFCGSGTTGIACKLEGFEFVGMEQDEEYSKIAIARIENDEKADDLKIIQQEQEKEEEIVENKVTQLSIF